MSTPTQEAREKQEKQEPQVLVYVEGGVVQAINATTAAIRVRVIDADNLKEEGADVETIYNEALELYPVSIVED
jgi:hypothetical protein